MCGVLGMVVVEGGGLVVGVSWEGSGWWDVGVGFRYCWGWVVGGCCWGGGAGAWGWGGVMRGSDGS